MEVLRVEHLYKNFGKHQILEDVNFTVPEHGIFGFLGQNGAGKTTTMKMALGLMKPTSGTIEIMGEKVTYGQTKTNRYVGYLPDVPEYYGFMTPREYLKLCGEITHMPSDKRKKRIDELIELVGLTKADKKIAGFSRGMKQRLGIAQALLNEPKLLICDEPTSALDPLGRKEILDILRQVKGKTTVLFSTHILSDVERICDNIAVLNKGKIVLSGAISDIKAKGSKEKVLVEFKDESELQQFVQIPEFKELKEHAQADNATFMVSSMDLQATFTYIMILLTDHHLVPRKLEAIEPTLEDLFMEVVG